MRAVGQDRQLPALPGARVDAHALQHDGQKAGGDLLAGRHHGVIFARVVQRRGILAPGDQLIGDAGHGGHHDGDVVTGVDLALDVAGDIADAVEIGDRRSAEFHDKARHKIGRSRRRQKGAIHTHGVGPLQCPCP